MIKEAGFLWSAAMGNLLLCFLLLCFLLFCFLLFCFLLFCFLPSLFLCFLSSLHLCLLFLLVSLAEFLYLVSGISAGFSIIHKSVDKCTENPFNNFLITCGISTFPYLHPRDYGYPQGY